MLSVSVTTRPKRPSEIDGRDYVFLRDQDFDQMIHKNELLEHAKVFGHWYGTPRKPVEQALASGRDVVFDIDWQGTLQLCKTARSDVVTVFVLPPSTEELARRLHTRAEDRDEVVAQRMAKAADEMYHWGEYDYVIVNTDVQKSVEAVATVLAAERLKRERQIGLADFVSGLRGSR
jgi:guanylate kinase